MKRSIFALVLALFLGCSSPNESAKTAEGFVEINGSEVFFSTIGKGEPLVVVHGGPMMDHSYMKEHLLPLAEDFQLIFYDQRVCGRSSVEVDSASMNLDGFTEDIDLLRKALNLEKINLLGHSWGGLLAMKYAADYGEHLDKLVLSNSIAPNVTDWQKENTAVAQRMTEKDLSDRQQIMTSGDLNSEDPREALRNLLRISFRNQMYDTANLKKLSLNVPKDYFSRSQLFGLLGSDLQSFDLYHQLKSVEAPVLIMYGEEEPAVEIYAEKMTQVFPDASLKIIDGSGHFPFIERQNEFLTSVTSFLRKP